MGKKQHQSDKLYLTASEWKNSFGGKKTTHECQKDQADFRRLPFNCCSLSFQPAKHPYSTLTGNVFDLENIVPFLKKHNNMNPVTGETIDPKTLFKLNLFTNAKEQYHCPITYKIFNDHTHIVAISKTGNVFSNDCVEELNVKAGFYKDLLTDEPFTKKDIITIQDPTNLSKFNMNNFHYIKENLKWAKDDSMDKEKPDYYLKSISSEAQETLAELKKTYVAPTTSQASSNYISKMPKADSVNAAGYSTGRVAASFTSTAMDICTEQEAAIIDEDVIRWGRVAKQGKKGYACLVTNLGRLNIELFCDQVPRTCENFLKLCENKYYKDTIFHRSIRNFMIQGGDPTGTGTGGQSVWGKSFPDEFKPTLSHNGRGILSMANSGPNTNKSQFFITFKSCAHLDSVHSVFGKVVGGIDVLMKMEAVEVDKKDRPKTSIKIEDCLVFVDPYKEVDEQIKAERLKSSEPEATSKIGKKKEAEVSFDSLKAKGSGVGKYLNLAAVEKKHKITGESQDNKSKKIKTGSFGNFSGW